MSPLSESCGKLRLFPPIRLPPPDHNRWLVACQRRPMALARVFKRLISNRLLFPPCNCSRRETWRRRWRFTGTFCWVDPPIPMPPSAWPGGPSGGQSGRRGAVDRQGRGAGPPGAAYRLGAAPGGGRSGRRGAQPLHRAVGCGSAECRGHRLRCVSFPHPSARGGEAAAVPNPQTEAEEADIPAAVQQGVELQRAGAPR